MKYQKIGPYILLQKIAAGGMADIFLAKKTGPNNLNSFYAIKKILEKYAELPEFHKMFYEEAKITNALSLDIHKNVMTSATYEKVGKHYVFVMEYIKGVNLKHFLKLAEKQQIKLRTEGILYIIAEIASGLNHLHNLVNLKTGQPLNLIHRDISPQNIMISHNGQIKIIDFGIAKASILEETQADAGIKGKMAYMSPEQAAGEQLDNRSDIFSLGTMLWELLANRRLFLADSSMKTLRNVRNCQIPSIKKINPSVSSRVEQILAKSLAKNKEERYKHATEFAEDLYQVIQETVHFSSYHFERFSKQVYTDDIIKNRRLLAKYINLSVEQSDAFLDITNVGADIDIINKEPTQDLSTLTSAKTIRPSTPPINTTSNTATKNKTQENEGVDVDFDLDPVFEHKLKNQQKYFVQSKFQIINNKNQKLKTKTSSVYKSSKPYEKPHNTEKKGQSAPFFAIAFSFSLAIAGFFLFSTTQQQNTIIDKTLSLVKNILQQPKQESIASSSPELTVNQKTEKKLALTKAPSAIALSNKDLSKSFITYIYTSPAGVEILINDVPISISPNNINLPKNKIIKITLKKYRYKTKEFFMNTKNLLGQRRTPSSITSGVTINKQEIRVILQKIKTANNAIAQ